MASPLTSGATEPGAAMVALVHQDVGATTPPSRTVLPTPAAHLVSLAVRSTGLAIRLGGAMVGYGLDAARSTTLGGLALGRAVLERILIMAAKDTMYSSDSEHARAEAETIIERAVERLHHAMGHVVFWTAAGFRTASASLSVFSEGSQFVFSSLDRFFGSTDSSRAMASIVTMIRRELQNPATGLPGEAVSVVDLLLVLCGMAYLQRLCRALLEEESANLRVEETVWDVVVLRDGVRFDLHEETYYDSSQDDPPALRHDSTGRIIAAMQNHGTTPSSDYHDDDDPPALQLEREILKSLPDNAKVSITREIAVSETIRVNIVTDTQQVRVEPPPGLELVEEHRDACHAASEVQPGQDDGHESGIACSQFVFRHERRQEKHTSIRKVDGDISHVAGYVEELDPKRPEQTLANIAAAPADGKSSNRLLSGGKLAPGPRSNNAWEKRGGFRSVLKRSMSIFTKDLRSASRAAIRKGRYAVPDPMTTVVPEAARHAPPILAGPSPGGRPREPFAEETTERPQKTQTSLKTSPSCTDFVTVHESLRQSTISLTETYSIITHDDRPPSSTFGEAMMSSTLVNEGRTEAEPGRLRGGRRQHRRARSHNASIYTLAASKSECSLTRHQVSALSAADALGMLRQVGTLEGMFPARHLVHNITRYMRFASATYGSRFLKVLGIIKAMPIAAAFDDVHHELLSFAHHTRSHHSDILLSSFVDAQGGTDATGSTNTGIPLVHYISLDHVSKAVVLSCRGTLDFEDVLTDMACEYDDLVWRGTAYKVHKGVHASARRLLYAGDGRVLATLKATLEEFPDYGLVLTGHSLGGAVTSLLGVMLSEPGLAGTSATPFVTCAEPHTYRLLNSTTTTTPTTATTTTTNNNNNNNNINPCRLPQHICLPAGRPIHVYAYGPPSTMSAALRAATRGLITTVVHRHDLVPHLSLGVLHDVQAVALALKGDNGAAKAELRRRIWRAFCKGVAPHAWRNGGGGGGPPGGGGGPPGGGSGGDGVGGGGGGGGVGGNNGDDGGYDDDDDDDWVDAILGMGKGWRDHEKEKEKEDDGEGDNDDSTTPQWAYATLKVLRASMVNDKLVPPGEVFVVERAPAGATKARFGRRAQRVVLRYVRDVERRFGEVRFGKGMLSDHSPRMYEAALERLMVGVGVREES